ncbi:unnamed protein product [Auanema sp. JU1783]|nr:unnamed protein product [Auanema sp. JU1783]
MRDGGKRALEMCLKILPYEYPIEMETMKGINFVMFEETPLIMIVMYIILFTFGYVVMACICGSILIRILSQSTSNYPWSDLLHTVGSSWCRSPTDHHHFLRSFWNWQPHGLTLCDD